MTIIEFKNEISKKPFVIKETSQFWVRIKDSSQLANRSTIQMLFSASINQKNSISRLKSAAALLKESFLHTIDDIHSGSGFITEVDLDIMKKSVTDSEWFLTEKNLWGKHTSQGGYEIGINSVLHDLSILNTKIKIYNESGGTGVRRTISENLVISYNKGGNFHEKIPEFLDRLIDASIKFLRNME